jgi:hypothetical protein
MATTVSVTTGSSTGLTFNPAPSMAPSIPSYDSGRRAFTEWVERRAAAEGQIRFGPGEDWRSPSYCSASREHFFQYQMPQSFVLNEAFVPIPVDFQTMQTWMAVEATKPDGGARQVARTDFDDASSVRTYFTGFDPWAERSAGTPALFRTVWMPEGILDVRVSTVDDALRQHERTVREVLHGSHGQLKPVHDVRIDRQLVNAT